MVLYGTGNSPQSDATLMASVMKRTDALLFFACFVNFHEFFSILTFFFKIKTLFQEYRPSVKRFNSNLGAYKC